MTIISRVSVVFMLACATSAPSFAAEAYDAATRTAIQEIITKQLDAVAHDDAAGAESFASKSIQQKYPEPNEFLAMVKSSYGALVKPRSTHFDEIAASASGPAQKVTIVAADGTIWTAVYLFEQSDGSWRIAGCGLKKVDDQQDI